MCLSQEPVNIRNQHKTGASTMSKNVCSTCKHYERVNDNEPEDRGDCTLYPTWLDVPAAHYCGQWAASTVQEEQTPLDIDWNQVPEGYDWVAQDSNGDIYAFTEKPIPNLKSSLWIMQDGETFSIGGRHPFNTDWANTLTKRPGTN